jgi:hypothetical protein
MRTRVGSPKGSRDRNGRFVFLEAGMMAYALCLPRLQKKTSAESTDAVPLRRGESGKAWIEMMAPSVFVPPMSSAGNLPGLASCTF